MVRVCSTGAVALSAAREHRLLLARVLQWANLAGNQADVPGVSAYARGMSLADDPIEGYLQTFERLRARKPVNSVTFRFVG